MSIRNIVVLTTISGVVACAAPDSIAPALNPDVAFNQQSAPAVTVTLDSKASFANPTVLAMVGGVTAFNTGFGSAIATVRDHDDDEQGEDDEDGDLFLLTDRGPNVDYRGTQGAGKAFLAPGFAPTITSFRLKKGSMILRERIPLRDGAGNLISGLPNLPGQGGTNEFLYDVNGQALQPDPNGIDSEGLVAMEDGTFWVSDEYGPHLAHFARDGREIKRWNPFNNELPAVFAKRRANRGMEGLALSTDGKWLVGLMQSPLNNPSSAGVQNISRAIRILFKNLVDGSTRQLLYINEASSTINSDIVAVSPTEFLVLERDGNFLLGSPTSTVKRIYKIDISGATDISSPLASGVMIPTATGPRTLEQASLTDIAAAGIVPVTKSLLIDLLAFGYPHDKAEGITLRGNKLFVSNDDDFAVTDGSANVPVQKILPPTGLPDFSSVWVFKILGLRRGDD